MSIYLGAIILRQLTAENDEYVLQCISKAASAITLHVLHCELQSLFSILIKTLNTKDKIR